MDGAEKNREGDSDGLFQAAAVQAVDVMEWVCAPAQHTDPDSLQYSVRLEEAGSACTRFTAPGSGTQTSRPAGRLVSSQLSVSQPEREAQQRANSLENRSSVPQKAGNSGMNSQRVRPSPNTVFEELHSFWRRISELGEFVCFFKSYNVLFCQTNLQHKRMAYHSIMGRGNTKQTRPTQHQSKHYLWRKCKEM